MPISISNTELAWRSYDGQVKALSFTADSGTVGWVEVRGSGTVSQNAFYWGAVPRQQVDSNHPLTVYVRPPLWATGTTPHTVTAGIPYTITDNNGHVVQDSAISCRNDATDALLPGDLQISVFAFNPPGNDLADEGEYFELRNLSASQLLLSGATVMQVVFNANGSRSSEQAVTTFPLTSPTSGQSDIGRSCSLAAGQSVRVLTRKKNDTDPIDDPLRFYLGRGNPIWNNSGDRITINSAQGLVIARFSYGSQRNTPGKPDILGPGQTPPIVQPSLVVDFTVDVDATFDMAPVVDVIDGDVIEISTDDASLAQDFVANDHIGTGTIGNAPFSPEYLPSGRPLLILPRRIGASELPPSQDTDWPMSDAPKYSLITSIGTAMIAIGAGTTIGVTVDTGNQPIPLLLGVNDNVLWDNRGIFRVRVRVFR